MDINLLFLAKPVDKHGIILAHIPYPPLATMAEAVFNFESHLEMKQLNLLLTYLINLVQIFSTEPGNAQNRKHCLDISTLSFNQIHSYVTLW